MCGGGQGGGSPGEKGAGGIREAGEEGAENGRNTRKLRNTPQYFSTEKARIGGRQQTGSGSFMPQRWGMKSP